VHINGEYISFNRSGLFEFSDVHCDNKTMATLSFNYDYDICTLEDIETSSRRVIKNCFSNNKIGPAHIHSIYENLMLTNANNYWLWDTKDTTQKAIWKGNLPYAIQFAKCKYGKYVLFIPLAEGNLFTIYSVNSNKYHVSEKPMCFDAKTKFQVFDVYNTNDNFITLAVISSTSSLFSLNILQLNLDQTQDNKPHS